MSKHETWRTRMYWKRVGGLLIEEYIAVNGNKEQGKRLIDGIIVLGEEHRILKDSNHNIEGKNIVIIQTKRGRLGMYLLGQSYFSKLLIERHKPKSIRNVAICGKSDTVMEKLAKENNIEVVVIQDAMKD